MTAIIYQPTKSTMQSGLRNTKHWILEFIPKHAKSIDPIMGWTGSQDTLATQVQLKFNSKDQAVAYADKHDLEYIVHTPKPRAMNIKSYVDNFK